MATKISPMRQKFVDYYAGYRNATKAAEMAGYSKKSAMVQGCELLKVPEVRKAIALRQQKVAKRAEIKGARVLRELKNQAFFDPGLIAAAGITRVEQIAELPLKVRRMITGWKWDRNDNLVLQFVDRQKALDSLARHFGLFNDSLTVNVNVSMCDAMQAARERVIAAGIDLPALPVGPGYAIDEVIDAEVTAVVDSESDDQQEDSDGDDDE